MNHAELAALTTAFAPVIKEFVAQGLKERDDKIDALADAVALAEVVISDLTKRIADLVLKQGPPGKDGKDGANGRDGVDGIPGAAGVVGPAGRDGVDGAAGADGAAGDRGMPGLDGKDGRDGRDGLPGINGKDGLGFDDMERVETETQYGVRFVRGTEVREFLFDKPQPLPSPTLADWYKGVWREGLQHHRGDCVTLHGGLYLAKADTWGKPASSADWQLIVKRGDKGKDGTDGRDGAQGPQGKPGRDLTQIGPDGQQVQRW